MTICGENRNAGNYARSPAICADKKCKMRVFLRFRQESARAAVDAIVAQGSNAALPAGGKGVCEIPIIDIAVPCFRHRLGV